MSITLMFGCAQIETTVRDLDGARGFMRDVLGAGPIEQKMAAEITALFPSGAYSIEHYDCGEGLFQFNQPTPSAKFGDQTAVHQAYLDRVGPCVTNLNYYVDDAAHAQALLANLGAPSVIEGPSNLISSLADYGPENTRPGGDTRQFYFLAARELVGFDLELMKPNFRRFTEQTAQHPCFVHPRPAAGSGDLKLLRLTVVVRDLEATYANLVAIFAPASRSKPYDICRTALASSFRIGLGGLELEYVQPASKQGVLGEVLDRFGPGVAAAQFAANDAQQVLSRAREQSVAVDSAFSDRPSRIASRGLVGFDVVVEPARAGPFA